MKKNAVVFLLTFMVGAAAALIYRGVRYQPYAEAAPPKQEQAAPAAPAAAAVDTVPVNSVCPICGMDVDPSIPPADYQGKKVGFGCAACPPRFARDPERWGPLALQNKVEE
jgi:YHS domain-containing protein